MPKGLCPEISKLMVDIAHDQGIDIDEAMLPDIVKEYGEKFVEPFSGDAVRKAPTKKLVKLQAGDRTYTFSRTDDGLDEEFKKGCLKILNESFRTASLEEYDQAMLGVVLKEGLQKYGRGKERISLHQYARIQRHMVHRLQLRYGPYINVFRRKDRFNCNLQDCYKTDMGRLYNSRGIKNLFVTTHAIERFEERTEIFKDSTFMVRTRLEYQRMFGTQPTAWDLMEDRLHKVYQYAKFDDSLYLNLSVGVLAVDRLPNMVCVGKTFLTPEMAPKHGWMEELEEYIMLLDDITDAAIECKPNFWGPSHD